MTGITSSIRAVLLAALMIGSVLAGAAVFTGGAGAQDDALAAFDYHTDQETRQGDLTENPYTIRLDNTDTATVVFTGRNTNTSYWSNVTVQDDDGDGVVNLTMNTYSVGHENPFRADSGSVVNHEGGDLGDQDILPVDSTEYELLVSAGDDPATAAENPSDTATLLVDYADTEIPDAFTGPQGTLPESLDDVYDVPGPFADTVEGYSAESDQIVAPDDTMIIAPFGDGYYGSHAYALEETGSQAEALQWLLEEGHIEFSFEANSTDKTLDVSHALEEGALTFDSQQIYHHQMFAIDMGAEIFVDSNGEYHAAEAGERYIVSFAKAGRFVDSGDEQAERTVYRNVTVVETRSDNEAPVNTLQEGELAGETTLAPGTNLTIHANTGNGVETYNTTVSKVPGRDELNQPPHGVELHPWNVTTEFGDDVEITEVEFQICGENYGHVGGFPPSADIAECQTEGGNSGPGDGTTTDDGGDGDATTTDDGGDGDGTTTDDGGDGDGTTTDDGGDGEDGDGGTIPGFTAAVGLLAALAAALIAVRRNN